MDVAIFHLNGLAEYTLYNVNDLAVVLVTFIKKKRKRPNSKGGSSYLLFFPM